MSEPNAREAYASAIATDCYEGLEAATAIIQSYGEAVSAEKDRRIAELEALVSEDMVGTLAWILQQAEAAMSTSAGCATTHGDPGGGLEDVNRYASDIAINCQMANDRIAAHLTRAAHNPAEQGDGK